ncbi:helix-hairpin-helix domain-containing protein [Aquirufa ecclesiirivi]|uniref:Helix-hairpin-helix domain-containing protein n=1 Tax=Aquirufa ecclesiirivi TaxID=2715124 RepID=A0ABT4JEF2_9BACT|nr:helix-hairpin-helix domain-containing protein [Aquirufa ecclesiirivi]MCZ2474670.1 helix-hairpin-helix domain-containing protein [Aquirufa ecclesiirivi]
MWKNKVHYYLRFILGMTRSELLGLLSLFIFLLLADIFSRWMEYQSRQQVMDSFQPTYWTKTLIEMEKSNQPEYTYSKSKFSSTHHGDDLSHKSKFPTREVKREKKQAWQININQADSLAWIALPGIGPAFAKRILAYRDKLGGFYRTAQLKEVYGLDTLWINEHSSQFHVGKGVFRYLYINRSDWKEFRHPYLPYRQANLILNYRKQHGPFQNWEDLKKVKQLDEAVWQRLSPYLSFEP